MKNTFKNFTFHVSDQSSLVLVLAVAFAFVGDGEDGDGLHVSSWVGDFFGVASLAAGSHCHRKRPFGGMGF